MHVVHPSSDVYFYGPSSMILCTAATILPFFYRFKWWFWKTFVSRGDFVPFHRTGVVDQSKCKQILRVVGTKYSDYISFLKNESIAITSGLKPLSCSMSSLPVEKTMVCGWFVRLACVRRIDELVSQNTHEFLALLGRREIHVEAINWPFIPELQIVFQEFSRNFWRSNEPSASILIWREHAYRKSIITTSYHCIKCQNHTNAPVVTEIIMIISMTLTSGMAQRC